jgi:hypothetical protein
MIQILIPGASIVKKPNNLYKFILKSNGKSYKDVTIKPGELVGVSNKKYKPKTGSNIG